MDPPTTPSAVGAHAEAAVASALVRAGFAVFMPVFSSHGRVDLVYCGGGPYVGVQCKSARLLGGNVLYFMTCSNTANVPKRYGTEVTEFGVYSPHTDLVYLVPAAIVPARACSLRLAPTENGQAAGVRWAKDFELGPP